MDAVRAVIFANGSLPDPSRVPGLIRPDDLLIAADGGSRHLLGIGLSPAVVIGDLDSLAPVDRARLEAAGTRLVAHPRDKDQTDLELAIEHAVAAGSGMLLIVGALGGRLDQTLANLSLLTRPDLLALDARLDDGREAAWYITSRTEIHGRAGEIVSLLPWGGPVTGVRTENLRWPLKGETLLPDSTRGVSNELLGESASVAIGSGLLLVIHTRK